MNIEGKGFTWKMKEVVVPENASNLELRWSDKLKLLSNCPLTLSSKVLTSLVMLSQITVASESEFARYLSLADISKHDTSDLSDRFWSLYEKVSLLTGESLFSLKIRFCPKTIGTQCDNCFLPSRVKLSKDEDFPQ